MPTSTNFFDVEKALLDAAIDRIIEDKVAPQLKAAGLELVDTLLTTTYTQTYHPFRAQYEYERVLVQFTLQEIAAPYTRHILNQHLWRFRYSRSPWKRGDHNNKALKIFFQRFPIQEVTHA